MITLLKTAKKERSAAEKAMISDAGKGAISGVAEDFVDHAIPKGVKEYKDYKRGVGRRKALRRGLRETRRFAPSNFIVGSLVGGTRGGVDGYIGQKVLGGEFDDSLKGSLKRNVTGGAITGAAEGLGNFVVDPGYYKSALSPIGKGVLRGGVRGAAGKVVKDKLKSKMKKSD